MTAAARQIERIEIEKAIFDMAKYVHNDFASAFDQRIREGHFFGFVPEASSEERLGDFKSGGLTVPGKEFSNNSQRLVQKINLIEDFARTLADIVHTYPGSGVVGFDVVSDKIKLIDADDLDLEQAPFGILKGINSSKGAILNFVNNFASAWTTVLFVVSDPDQIKNVSQFSRSLILFAVGAYDGESFIFWKRD